MPKTLLSLVALLVLAASLFAAPRPKNKGYVPDGWIDTLCNMPASDRPWVVMQERCKDMDRETWMAIGVEMSTCMNRRLKRLGLGEMPSVFDVPECRDDLDEAGYVAGTLCHYKWIETQKGKPNPWELPMWFWDSGRLGDEH